MTTVQRHPDRVSVSFADGAEDADWIVTVTFDFASLMVWMRPR
jgi:prepilin-type processing-associated H-X9-DG protein